MTTCTTCQTRSRVDAQTAIGTPIRQAKTTEMPQR